MLETKIIEQLDYAFHDARENCPLEDKTSISRTAIVELAIEVLVRNLKKNGKDSIIGKCFRYENESLKEEL